MGRKREIQKSDLKSKIVVSFILVILLMGISITWILQKRLGTILRDANIQGAVVSEISSSYVLTSVGVSIGVIILAGFIAFYISKGITNPLLELRKKTEDISAGNLEVKIKAKSNDEIGQLASAFNKMAKDLKKSRQSVDEQSENLEKEVKKRTNELRNKMDELERLKQATLNIMEDINEANKQLKEVDKMKDEFLSVVSHELKTPITPITAYIEMFKDGDLGKVSGQQKEALVTIARNTKRLKLLIEDVLDISRIQNKRMKFNIEKVNLNELVKTTISDRQTFADEKGIKLISNIQKLPNIKTDRYRITQVLINFIDNAVKFSPDKSKITMTAEKSDGCVKFSVIDRGIGISKENQGHVFEKFFQVDPSVKRKYGGTGLGLAISKGIIEMLGGCIGLKSEVGKGSEFYIGLPIKGECKLKCKNIKTKETRGV